MLPGRVPLREPWPSEIDFFRTRPDVSGLAGDDGAVTLNPFIDLPPHATRAVALNEAARVLMFRMETLRPTFAVTADQQKAFANYGPTNAIKETIAARILTGDPSALTPTEEQLSFVERLAKALGFVGRSEAIARISAGFEEHPTEER